MPTVITHAIVGASITMLRQHSISPVKLLVVAVMLAVLPDLDVIGFHYGIAYSDVWGHRGFTHSLPFAALVSIITALTAFRDTKPVTSNFWLLTFLLFLATSSHGILDAFTNAGLGVGFLIPFDDTRFFAPWRPLTASPLSISRFLSGSGIPILLNEFRWIGIPVLGFVTLVCLAGRYLRFRSPDVHDAVIYTVAKNRQGRTRPANPALIGDKLSKRTSGPPAMLIASIFFTAVSVSVFVTNLPLPILGIYLLVSMITFGAYAIDKSAARAGRWRTSERTLHMLAVAGGWPGALIAQQALRHKSRKTSFRAVFWITALLNCAGLVWLHTPKGRILLEQVLGTIAGYSFT